MRVERYTVTHGLVPRWRRARVEDGRTQPAIFGREIEEEMGQ